MKSSSYLDTMIRKFAKLPGIGPKSASRIAFHILGMPREDVEGLARAMVEMKLNIFTCRLCGGISDGEICSICLDGGRDRSVVCAVEDAKDAITIEEREAALGEPALAVRTLTLPAARPEGRKLEGDAAAQAATLMGLLRDEAKVL